MEIWRFVPSIPGLEASSLGRVRCTSYMQEMPHGGVRVRSFGPTVGVQSYACKVGEYRRLTFRFRGKTYKVHRAVCEAFNGPAPFVGAVVMHIDENSLNNLPDNLRWGTQRENLGALKFRTERCSAAKRRAA